MRDLSSSPRDFQIAIQTPICFLELLIFIYLLYKWKLLYTQHWDIKRLSKIFAIQEFALQWERHRHTGIMTRFPEWSDHLYGDVKPRGSLICQRRKSKWFYIIVHKGVRVRIVLGVTRGHITRSILHLTKEVSFYLVNSSHVCRPEGEIWFPS